MTRPTRLKIAFVVHDFHRHGGHSRYAVELAERFKRDHDVHVYCNRADHAATAGIMMHHVPACRISALSTVVSFIGPATLSIRGAFDVIHAQGLCGFRHTIATAHICLAAWYEALINAGVRLSVSQRIFRTIVKPLERKALAQSSTRHVIAISKRVRDDVNAHYGRTNNVDVIHHGVDANRFHPQNRERWRKSVRSAIGLGQDDFVALYVGDLKKGVDAAMTAVARTPGVKLLVVSSSNVAPYRGRHECRTDLTRVIFHPATAEIEKFFAAADVFLFPTIYDAFGLVLSEAMATGLPVITSPAAGAAELLVHDVNGLITEAPWAIDQIASHLKRLRDDTFARDRLGQAARKTVEPMTWDRVAQDTMAVYLKSLMETE